MKFLKLFLMTWLIIVAVGGIAAFGQSDRGSISGTVTDQSGAVVSNAKVTITGTETGEQRETTTSSNGSYSFPQLRAALYQITVEAPGFQQSTITDFKVAVQVAHTLNIKLEVGQVTNVVTVNAEAQALNADTPTRQTNVTEQQVKELPLIVTAGNAGRTPLAFIFLDSSVNAAGDGNGAAGGTSNSSRFKIDGGQAGGTEILIDGASVRRQQNGTFFTEVAPGPNAYKEFTVSTSSYSAEFGNSSGGIVNFTLKSGTNDFHGEVYDLLQNEKFNANSFVNKTSITAATPNGLPRGRDNQNDFGFNIGGPIGFLNFGEGGPVAKLYRNKAFFFFNYEGYRFRQGENVIVTVPTARMRTGDFGELLTDPYILNFRFPNGFQPFANGIRIYDPRVPSSVRQAIPGNRLDLNNNVVNGRPLIDPAGLAILQYFPLPNVAGAGVYHNYQTSAVSPLDMNQFTGKTDFVINEKQRLTLSYSRRSQDQIIGFPRFPLPFTSQGVFNQTFKSDILRAQHDYTISSNTLNHFNIGYNFFNVFNRNTTVPFQTSSLGIPVGSTQNVAFPRVGFPGYGNFVTSIDPRAYQDIGSTFFTDHIRQKSIDISDFVTLVRGNQTLKIGGSFRYDIYNVFQKIDPGGSFNFRNEQTASDADPDGGYPIASLITGATEFAFNTVNSIEPAFRQLSQSYFVQDDFKVSPKLTLNLGLRYDLPGLRSEEQDRYRTFDPTVPNPAAGGRLGAIIGAAGQGGLSAAPKTLANNDKTNIGPRLGAAYALNNRTVVRAGIGLYYAPVAYGINGGGGGDGLQGYNGGRTYLPNNRNANNFLSTFPSLPTVDPNGQFVGQPDDINYFVRDFRTGRTLQYSVDLQRELPFKFVASIGYVGHRDDRLRSNFGRINALPLDGLKLGNPILNTNINNVTAQQRAYASSVGVAIPANGNAVYPGFNGSVAQALRPFPQYQNIVNFLEHEGESTYNSLQIKLNRRFAQGIQFGANYTYSRLITNASEDVFGGSPIGGVLQNPFDIKSLKSISPNNPPQAFVANFIAELPLGKGKKFLNGSRVLDILVGGFQIGGVFRYQSGTPIVVFSPFNTGILNTAGYYGNFRPNLTGQPVALATQQVIAGQAGTIRVLNPAAFAAPKNYDANPAFLNADGSINPAYAAYFADPTSFFGNAPPVITDYRNPAFFNEDLNILKKTRITERITFEIGAEFFNVFNRVRYGAPSTDIRDANFGVKRVINPFVGANRVIQLRGRIIF